MGRKNDKFHHNRFRDLAGFSLIELLIGLVLSTIIAVVLYELLTTQNRTYSVQDDIAEMQQNLRVAIERVSRDVMTAGLAKPPWSSINGADASSWYSSASGYPSLGLTTIATGQSINMVGCFEGTVAYLNAAAAAGSTSLTLTAAAGDSFNTSTKQDINVGGMENAKITAVAGSTLTIDRDPVAGGAQGFLYDHPANSIVCLVKWVTYWVGNDNVLYVNTHQGDGDQPVALNITAMTVSLSGKLVTITITGRTRNPDRTTGQYFTSQVTNKVLMRN